jgi:GTP-binding protein EngB required for normal cell division
LQNNGKAAQVYLVDLPGYGYARRSKNDRSLWNNIIKNYFVDRDLSVLR